MPGMSGVEVCAYIRKKSPVPVLFLTAKSQDQDKVEAYTEGGDDYLVKPFSQTELLMKVKSLLRRYKEYQGKSAPKARPTIGGNISVDTKTRSALKGDRKIALTDKEFDILQFFMEHKGRLWRTRIFTRVSGERSISFRWKHHHGTCAEPEKETGRRREQSEDYQNRMGKGV